MANILLERMWKNNDNNNESSTYGETIHSENIKNNQCSEHRHHHHLHGF